MQQRFDQTDIEADVFVLLRCDEGSGRLKHFRTLETEAKSVDNVAQDRWRVFMAE